jgi:levansucrase
VTPPSSPSRWHREDLAGAARQTDAALPLIDAALPALPGHDLWDMWHVARPDGSTAIAAGESWWFFLATPAFPDPEARHDHARIRLLSHGANGWRDHGWTFPQGFTPGSREWSGSCVLAGDGTLTMFFTATGRRGEPPTFEQRLFETRAPFAVVDGAPRIGAWTTPVESVAADGHWYAVADDRIASAQGIRGFRDPGYFRDPADGAEYLLFTANAGEGDDWPDGVIGIARRGDGGWRLLPPVIAAPRVNSELERPHIVVHAGRYYLFWSTHRHRFAPGLDAPTGLYAMVAERIGRPWRPVNVTGLVAANPLAAPVQAYCWWVTQELEVASFVNYWRGGPAQEPRTPEARRAAFGGTPAPFFRLSIDGDRVRVI